MRAVALIAMLALAACGADGPPERPETGVTISGEITAGVSGRL